MTLAVTDVGVGPTVVLLHAFPVNRHLWDGVADRVAGAGVRVIAPDLPGFGDSAPTGGPPDLGAAAQAVFDTLDDLGIDEFALGGLSMGGYVAMEMLRRLPDRLSRLLLVDTKMGADPQPARDNRLAVADRVLAEDSTEFLVDAMIGSLLGRRTVAEKPEVVAAVSGWIRRTAPAAVAWAQRAMAQRPDSSGVLGGYPRPSLVVAGSDDTISPPAEQREILGVLQQGQLVFVPDVGHLSAVEDPAGVAGAVIPFVRGY